LSGRQRTVAPLNLADVGKALRLLVRLGLLLPEGEGFRLDWETFNRPAPLDGLPFDVLDPRELPSFRQAAAIDSQRAERALELLDMGNYDVERHLAAVFRDLAYVRDEDYALLKSKVHRHRNRPPGPKRWRNTWKAFQYALKRCVAEVRAPKCRLYLGDGAALTCHLRLDLSQFAGRVLAVRMVSRVEWPWHFSQALSDAKAGASDTPAVLLELRSGNSVLFTRAVGPREAEVRYSLHPDEWPGVAASLTLSARCDRPLPGVHVEAWLEARLGR
jgi:hypothetical protein